jgi:hypothetical protein
MRIFGWPFGTQRAWVGADADGSNRQAPSNICRDPLHDFKQMRGLISCPADPGGNQSSVYAAGRLAIARVSGNFALIQSAQPLK